MFTRIFKRKKIKDTSNTPFNFEEVDEKPNCIVIDNGSYNMKAGFAGANHGANVYFRTLIHSEDDKTFIGDTVTGKLINQDCPKIEYPLHSDGVTINFDEMEDIYDYIFRSQMRVDPSENAIIMTEILNNTKRNREKLTQIMFEKFNIPSFYLDNQCFFSLVHEGKSTGIAINCGYGKTRIAPFHSSCLVNDYASTLDIGGKTIDNYLTQLLSERGHRFENSFQFDENIEKIKKTECFIAEDYQRELSNFNGKEYTIFNGDKILLDSIAFQSCEVLFDPSLVNQSKGISDVLCDTISKCDDEIKELLFQNIILSGGSSEVQGFKERLEFDIRNQVSEDTKFRIIAPHARSFLPWNGASSFGCYTRFKNLFISKEEYDEGKTF